MSRAVSNITREALFAQETGEAFLIILTMDHTSLEVPIRVSSDIVNTTSRGLDFIAFPFELTLPDNQENASPKAHLKINNIDRSIVKTLREINSPATVLIEVVRANAPDIIEAKFLNFKLVNVTYDEKIVEGDLTIEDFTSEPYPANSFSPSLFSTLF